MPGDAAAYCACYHEQFAVLIIHILPAVVIGNLLCNGSICFLHELNMAKRICVVTRKSYACMHWNRWWSDSPSVLLLPFSLKELTG